MNIQVYTKSHRYTASGQVKYVLITSLALLSNASVFAADSFQHKMLFMPTESMLKAEAKGRIMIYDGLKSETVHRAMNEQFDRIDNMMFVRIHHEQDNSESSVEDDGC